MIGFLIAMAGGALAPMIEEPVTRPVARAMGTKVEVADGEIRLLSFMIAMFAAGFACAVLEIGSPLGLAVGGALGYFGTRVFTFLKGIIDAKGK